MPTRPHPLRVHPSIRHRHRRGKLLLCQRPAHKRHGGLWEFPGGKVQPGESDFAAVERELAEELGVRVVEVGAVELSVRDAGSPFVIEFLPVVIEGEPRALEHAALSWVTEEELLRLALAPSDRRYGQWRVATSAVSPRQDTGRDERARHHRSGFTEVRMRDARAAHGTKQTSSRNLHSRRPMARPRVRVDPGRSYGAPVAATLVPAYAAG